MTLRIRPEAKADLWDAAAWYDARQAGLGEDFVEEVHAALQRIEQGPLHYPAVHGTLRRASVHRFPFVVYFDIDSPDILVFAVLHQRRLKDVLDLRLRGARE